MRPRALGPGPRRGAGGAAGRGAGGWRSDGDPIGSPDRALLGDGQKRPAFVGESDARWVCRFGLGIVLGV